MNRKKVTMQDIADACGLSRNTVSKVFNQRGDVPQNTREYILKTARELGYIFPQSAEPAPLPGNTKSIALFTRHMPASNHFATFFLPTFIDSVSRAGYNLKMFEISDEEIIRNLFPPHFTLNETAGFICIELFDPGYLSMLAQQGLPILSIDAPTHAADCLMECDFVQMENIASMFAIVNHLYAKGARRIGFVGDKEHCCSFYERWIGYASALAQAGQTPDESLCILASDLSPYDNIEWLDTQLSRIPDLPDAFVCANDYLAFHLMAALKKRGLSIPQDIMVAGFDGTPQSDILEPSLSTVIIPGIEIGRIAADTLLRRINNPSLPFTWTRVKTTPVFRSSTNRKAD